MSKEKTTVVEWLESKVDAMIKNGGDADLLSVIEHIQKAKEMEKEQIIDAANWDSKSISENGIRKGDKYYNETFNK